MLAVPITTAPGGTLYFTEFEGFPAGENNWSGTEGWIATDTTSGVQGIIQDPVGDLPLGRTAYLGFETPAEVFTTVHRSLDHDPSTGDYARLEIESLLGVQDSTNGPRDRFHLSFFNLDGDFLAALTFDNTLGNVTVDDGSIVRDTGIPFDRGSQFLAALQLLQISLDLEANVWSARLDNAPLFDQTFTTTGKLRTLGPLAFEWEISSGSVSTAGNNWLLVADLLVASLPPGPFEVQSIEIEPTGAARLTWPGHPGFDYEVQHSPDLQNWFDGLDGSVILNNAAEGPLSFTDTTASGTDRRCYKVIRRPTR